MAINIYSLYDVPNSYFRGDKDKACVLIARDHKHALTEQTYTSVASIVSMPAFNQIILKALNEVIYDNRPKHLKVTLCCRLVNTLENNLFQKTYQKVYVDNESGITAGVCCEAYHDTYFKCFFDFLPHPKLALLLGIA